MSSHSRVHNSNRQTLIQRNRIFNKSQFSGTPSLPVREFDALRVSNSNNNNSNANSNGNSNKETSMKAAVPDAFPRRQSVTIHEMPFCDLTMSTVWSVKSKNTAPTATVDMGIKTKEFPFQPVLSSTQKPAVGPVSGYFQSRLSILNKQNAQIPEKYVNPAISARLEKRLTSAQLDEKLTSRRQPLDDIERNRIEKLLQSSKNSFESVIEKFNIDVTKDKLSCLQPGTWLNDEVINFYMAMLIERDERILSKAPPSSPKKPSYYFNSFFVTRLLEDNTYCYRNVCRWTKKFDVFAMEKIVFPVNINNTHWALAVVFVQQKKICYYDSMNSSSTRYIEGLKRWVIDEAKAKKGIDLNPDEWKTLSSRESNPPQQYNGYDCGVFTITCADYLADDLPLTYSQNDMAEQRLKIASAIVNGSLPY